jgi:uncharacterized membrane protein
MIFNNKTYDIMKWIATVALPALVTLILAIGQIWNLSTWTVPIGATVAAVATFFAALLGVSSIKYKQQLKEGSDG